jgi:hypothetical protein
MGALQEYEESSGGIRSGNCKAVFRASFPVVRHAVWLRMVMRTTSLAISLISDPYGRNDNQDRSLSPPEEA